MSFYTCKEFRFDLCVNVRTDTEAITGIEGNPHHQFPIEDSCHGGMEDMFSFWKSWLDAV